MNGNQSTAYQYPGKLLSNGPRRRGIRRRTRPANKSEINRLLLESIATSAGPDNDAKVAAPPSPENRSVPFPATVEIVPAAETLRIR